MFSLLLLSDIFFSTCSPLFFPKNPFYCSAISFHLSLFSSPSFSLSLWFYSHFSLPCILSIWQYSACCSIVSTGACMLEMESATAAWKYLVSSFPASATDWLTDWNCLCTGKSHAAWAEWISGLWCTCVHVKKCSSWFDEHVQDHKWFWRTIDFALICNDVKLHTS